MTIGRAWMRWLLLAVTALAARAGRGSPRIPTTRCERPEPFSTRQVTDWNKGDLDAFLTGYWNSPKVVFQSGGQRFDGWEAMRERYRRRYQAAGQAMGQLAFSALDVEPLGPEAVLVRGHWRLTMPDGTKPGGLFTVIFRKLPEGWKIIHDHTSAEEPAPQPAAKSAGQ